MDMTLASGLILSWMKGVKIDPGLFEAPQIRYGIQEDMRELAHLRETLEKRLGLVVILYALCPRLTDTSLVAELSCIK